MGLVCRITTGLANDARCVCEAMGCGGGGGGAGEWHQGVSGEEGKGSGEGSASRRPIGTSYQGRNSTQTHLYSAHAPVLVHECVCV